MMEAVVIADLCDMKDKTQLLFVLLGPFLTCSSNHAGSFPDSGLEMVIISIADSTPLEPVSPQPLLRAHGSSQLLIYCLILQWRN